MAEPTVSARAARLEAWSQPVTSARYVDSPRAEALGRLGVATVEDLLRHYPHRYLDFTKTVPLGSLKPETEATAVGTVHEVVVKRPRPRLTVTEVAIVDDTGVLVGVWFNQPYIAQRFRAGEKVAFAGRVAFEFGLRQMRNPFVEHLGSSGDAAWLSRIMPVHRATEGLSTNWVRRLVHEALTSFADVPDYLPAELRARRDLPDIAWSLRTIHFPDSTEELAAARRRLAYEEFLALQVGLAARRHAVVEELAGFVHTAEGRGLAALMEALPFELTGDQQRAIAEVTHDMASPRPMNRMLLGDVGSGKTVVAAAALACAHDSGSQAAMMAPTEVLANQYALRVGPLLDAAGVPWALLTGSTATTERREILEGLSSGALSVVFGTHALLTALVKFHHLTLAVVDEQHRFGVDQRLGLRRKGQGVDLLVMTATPIPRSLALTLYGDLDTSWLRERPGGRGPEHTTTRLVPRTGREAAYEEVRAAVAEGRQAYIVCALVDESNTTEAKAAVKEADRLRTKVFPDLKVGLLTGQMRPAEKAAAMDAFRRGETDVLVSTTVIEVGVDVANATVMIVEDAERFGLAQLHQLRGRIGRAEHPGSFLLFADPKTEDGRRRMEAILSTADGFELAEQDMRLRGEGQILGERQSGLPELRLASVLTDSDLLDAAREDAQAIAAVDPHLESPAHGPLRAWVRGRFGRDWKWVSSG